MELTVVVMDSSGQPTEGAHVTIQPTGATGVTGSNGEVKLELGRALKYDVTVKSKEATVTVPYYVTKNGATRLVVNPTYVRSLEKPSSPLSYLKFNSDLYSQIGIGLGILVVLVIIWKLLRRLARRR